MGQILLYLLLLVTAIVSMKQPKYGAIAYFLMSIMAPQSIWFWNFQGVPAFSIVAATCMISLILAIMSQKVDFSIYGQKQNYLLIIFWAMFNLSDLLSPIGSYSAYTGADLVLETFNIIILMYFVNLPLLYSEDAFKKMLYVYMGMIMYYVYWANTQYFDGNYSQFSNGNRLNGPRFGPYRDQNVFATVFIVGMPFLLFGVFYFKKLWLKALMGLMLLFLWHSIFLTGSRGALLSVAVATLFSYFLIKSRIFGIGLIAGLVVAIIYQGGSMLERTTDTLETAQQQTEEEKIDPRIQSWDTGLSLIKMYPVLGVGVQRFQQATRQFFPGRTPYVAHNTFLNFAANTGILNGIIYLSFFWMQYKRFRKIRKAEKDPSSFYSFANNSIMTGYVGFFVGSMFLDLIIFESFYFLLLMGLILHQVYFKKREPVTEVVENTSQPKEPSRNRGLA